MAFNDTFNPNPAGPDASVQMRAPSAATPTEIISGGTFADNGTNLSKLGLNGAVSPGNATGNRNVPPVSARLYDPGNMLGNGKQYAGHYRSPVAVPDNTVIGQEYAGFNQAMIELAPSFDLAVDETIKNQPRWWHDRIPRGAYQLFNGTAQTRMMFRGAKLKYAGLDEWSDIDPYPTSTNNPCSLGDYTTPKYGWEAISWRGKHAEWGSDPICAEQFKYFAKAQQQLAWILAAGAEYGVQMQEVWNRDMFIYQSTLFERSFVMSSEYAGRKSDPKYIYNPFTKFDGTGDDNAEGHANQNKVKSAFILFESGANDVEPLNFDVLDKVRTSLKLRCPQAAVSRYAGEPIFALAVSTDDVEKYVRGNEEERKLWIEANPQALIEHYDFTSKVFRRWSIVEDGNQLRFKRTAYITSTETINWAINTNNPYGLSSDQIAWAQGKNLWLAVSVDPFTKALVRQGVNGTDIYEDNPEYIDAELAIAPVFMNQVFTNEFVPGITSLGSGTSFGPVPGLNGKWQWLNIKDRVTNPLGNVGNFFGMFEIFPRPEMHVFHVTSFLYKRCNVALPSKCPIENVKIKQMAGIESSDTVKVAAAVAAADFVDMIATILLDTFHEFAPGDQLTINSNTYTVLRQPTMQSVEVLASSGGNVEIAKDEAITIG